MVFTENTFHSINRKKNVAVKSKLRRFDSAIDCSGLSIKMAIKGMERYNIDQTEYTIRPGSFLLVNEGQRLRCTFESTDIVESICIYLDGETYDEVIDRHTGNDTLDWSHQRRHHDVIVDKYYMDGGGLTNCLTSLASVHDLSTLTDEHYIKITEQLALHQLGQRDMIANVPAMKYITKTELAKRLRLARAYIYDHYADPITLDQIAKVVCLSKYHLLRSYKHMFHITPYQALLQRRIEMAKEMLAGHNAIQEIGLSCGFNDRRSFSRVFKHATGYTPSSYRQCNLATN